MLEWSFTGFHVISKWVTCNKCDLCTVFVWRLISVSPHWGVSNNLLPLKNQGPQYRNLMSHESILKYIDKRYCFDSQTNFLICKQNFWIPRQNLWICKLNFGIHKMFESQTFSTTNKTFRVQFVWSHHKDTKGTPCCHRPVLTAWTLS